VNRPIINPISTYLSVMKVYVTGSGVLGKFVSRELCPKDTYAKDIMSYTGPKYLGKDVPPMQCLSYLQKICPF